MWILLPAHDHPWHPTKVYDLPRTRLGMYIQYQADCLESRRNKIVSLSSPTCGEHTILKQTRLEFPRNAEETKAFLVSNMHSAQIMQYSPHSPSKCTSFVLPCMRKTTCLLSLYKWNLDWMELTFLPVIWLYDIIENFRFSLEYVQ